MTRPPRRPRKTTALFLGGAIVGAYVMYNAINRFLNRDLLKGYTAG